MLVQRLLIRSHDLRIPAREHHVNDCLYRSIDRLCLTESFISVCVCAKHVPTGVLGYFIGVAVWCERLHDCQ